jgi:hypothetical protein
MDKIYGYNISSILLLLVSYTPCKNIKLLCDMVFSSHMIDILADNNLHCLLCLKKRRQMDGSSIVGFEVFRISEKPQNQQWNFFEIG